MFYEDTTMIGTTHTHGTSTAILGDCMDYMRSSSDKAFDLAIVDPPYGVGGFAVNKMGCCDYFQKKQTL